MKDSKFEEASTEELKKRAKTIKVVTITLATMLALLFIMGIILYNKLSSLFVIPLGLLPIVLINVGQLKQINKELHARNQQ